MFSKYISNITKTLIAIALLHCLAGASYAFASSGGELRGRIVDSQSGDPLMFASVVVVGTTQGAATDLDGAFLIRDIPPGTYEVAVSMVGYAKRIVTEVQVDSAGSRQLDLALTPQVIMGSEVVVTARPVEKDSEAALLRERQKAPSVSDAISQENIVRAGSSTAAEAMTKVTGVSVMDGRYFYVRGLGDRYTNARLNGATMASSDPDRNAISMDMFPAKFLESIVTTKTFTPDQPGDFTGGSVDIHTTTFPERLSVSFSTSASRNDAAPRDDGFLAYPGGSTDWLGKDDGTRSIPAELQEPGGIPNIGTVFRNQTQAEELDRLSRVFNPYMAPQTRSVPSYQSHSLSLGNQSRIFGKPLGYFASLSYNKSMTSYREGTTAEWYLAGNVNDKTSLSNIMLLKDYKSSEEVLWGGMANFSFKPHPAHEIHGTFNYNRRGESSSRYQVGTYPDALSDGTYFETRTLGYLERTLTALQAGGQDRFPGLADLDWSLSFTRSDQAEPDLRFFADDFTPDSSSGVLDSVYYIRASNYTLPTRYYRDLHEDLYDNHLNATIPFSQWSDLKSSFKVGGQLSHKYRTFRERRFTYGSQSARYDGDWYSFFSDDMGISKVDTLGPNTFYTFGNYIYESSSPASNYDGEQDVYAAYAMVDLPLSQKLRLITGARYEATRLSVESQDKNKGQGNLHINDLLPSVNLIFSVTDRMNLRAAYAKTLARPTFRELAPYSTFDFVGDAIFSGNPSLKRTLVDNYDLRWEWFARPGELLAVSAFYKNFQDPIERAIISQNNEGQFQNVPHARVTGLEFEARMRLDMISRTLRYVQFGGNLTLSRSEVTVPPIELGDRRSLDANAPGTRPLQGQSPYLLNLDLGYINPASGTSLNAYYNLFGERLSEVSLGGSPNVFEQPRGLLDLGFSQRLMKGLAVNFQARNLFDSSVKKVQEFKGNEFVVREYKLGRTFKMGLTYNL